jgi:hypothetical protein
MNTVNAIFAISNYLAVIPGLWLARKLLPGILNAFTIDESCNLTEKKPVWFSLWLASGWILTMALNDLLSWVQNWIMIFTQPRGLFTTYWGNVSLSFFSGFNIVLLTIIYATFIILSKKYWIHADKSICTDHLFLVMGVASLVWHLVRGTTLQFLTIQFPVPSLQGNLDAPGFILGWIVSLLILAVVMYVLNTRMKIN